MRLLFATRDLEIEGRVLDGFPLLVDDECWPLQPAQNFLLHILLDSGAVQSRLTWEAYGRRLYDFFAFLNANGLRWDAPESPVGLSVVSRYRNWSAGELGLMPGTINKRLTLVVKFYEWAHKRGHIGHLPFTRRDVKVSRTPGLLAHMDRSGNVVSKPSVMLRECKPSIRFLTSSQVQVCRNHLPNASHRLLFELMLQAGLRSCEARTFPLKYVFSPKAREDLTTGQMIRVALDPRDMWIKFEKPRSVDIPWRLMEDLHAYSLLERELRRHRAGEQPKALILSASGREFARSSVVDLFASLAKQVGFAVTAHMLRHTYGTYTLAALRKSRQFSGEPLLYVRDRMGHSDVQTTAAYLHLINQLEAQIVLQHEAHIDALFAEQSHAPSVEAS